MNVYTSIKKEGFQIMQFRRKASQSHFQKSLQYVFQEKTTACGSWHPTSLFTGCHLSLYPKDRTPLWCTWCLTSTFADRIAWGLKGFYFPIKAAASAFLHHQWEEGGKGRGKKGPSGGFIFTLPSLCFFLSLCTQIVPLESGSWKKIF